MYKFLSFFFFVILALPGLSQVPFSRLNFGNTGWTTSYAHPDYDVKISDGTLQITARNTGTMWQNLSGNIPLTDLSRHPAVYVKLRSQQPCRFQLRLIDDKGKETNEENPVAMLEAGTRFEWLTLDYSGKFKQNWPVKDTVNSRAISKFSILLNGGGNPDYTGTVEIDEIIFGDTNAVVTPYDPVSYRPKINQAAYLSLSEKEAILPTDVKTWFSVVNVVNGDTVFSGMSSEPKVWPFSKERVVKADFSQLETEGTYILLAEGLQPSVEFKISDSEYRKLLVSAAKAFYYNRASMSIDSLHGGKWARPAGHADDTVLIHPSAATAQRPAGFVIASPKGWYDAGDYNKYVVPAGISVWQLLSACDYFPDNRNLSLHIPESSNNIPDLTDEARWEADWLKTMQDPEDGGVYHKLTNAGFDATIMPDKAVKTRYVVQKSTAAALVFSALLSKIALTGNYDHNGSAECIARAEAAWMWATEHPEAQYDQEEINKKYDPDITTGDYGLQSQNTDWSDEWFWAATELYLATRRQQYLDKIIFQTGLPGLPRWESAEFMGIITIVRNKDKFPSYISRQASERLLLLAAMLKQEFQQSAYGLAMGTFESDFSWNSNGNALNGAMILFEAYEITADEVFRQAAMANIDYVLGKNPLNKCFMTGSGTNSPMNIHHRISAADEITEPVPGLVVNGPHNTYLKDCFYPTTIPAFAYLDNECSAATNEPVIYLYSSMVYALSASLHYSSNTPSGLKKKQIKQEIILYPNPNKGSFELSDAVWVEGDHWKIVDLTGKTVAEGILASDQSGKIEVISLPSGIYYFSITNKEEVFTTNFVIMY